MTRMWRFSQGGWSLLAAGALAASALGQGWGEVELIPTVADEGCQFGVGVSLSGDLALVGAPGDGNGGSAFVFDATTGLELHKLLALDGEPHLHFGSSVWIDGGLALVGDRNDNDNGVGSGSAYLFDAVTGQQLHKLLPVSGVASDRFGGSVSLDGGVALVGAHGKDFSYHPNAGCAYLFDATTGQELRMLRPLDPATEHHFGCSVSISGGLALVGAWGDDYNGSNSGAAYLFDVTTGQELNKFTPPDGAAAEFFGLSVSLSGNLAIIGAGWDDDNGNRSGSAYLYDVAMGILLHKITPSDGAPEDEFGTRVSISGDLALVGATGDDDNGDGSGSAYVFDVFTGEQLGKLTSSDGAAHDDFGCSVSLYGDRALVGASWHRHSGFGIGTGSAYVFDGLAPGRTFCPGDPGNGTPCPCNNDNDGSIAGAGCDNGVFASGAWLIGSGVASVSDDTLRLAATHLEPGNSGLYFQADHDLSPGNVWGDGLRCTGGSLKRLQVRFADAAGSSSTTIGIAAKAGNVLAGDTKYYQCWYRTTVNPPCGLGVFDFNSSNGYAITWRP